MQFPFTYRLKWPLLSAEAQRKKKKPMTQDELPLTEDIVLFGTYLQTEIKRHLEFGINSVEEFKQFQKLVLAYLISFNKRRSGEMAKVELKFYEELVSDKWKVPQEIEVLNEPERTLAKTMHMTYIKGMGIKSI